MAAADVVVGMTGASGSVYGIRLLEVLLRAGRDVHLTISPSALEVMQRELGRSFRLDGFEPVDLLGPGTKGLDLRRLHYHHYKDFSAGIASGSFLTAAMVVCPCSMGSAAAIAHGTSENLIHRAADVHTCRRLRRGSVFPAERRAVQNVGDGLSGRRQYVLQRPDVRRPDARQHRPAGNRSVGHRNRDAGHHRRDRRRLLAALRPRARRPNRQPRATSPASELSTRSRKPNGC